MEKVYFIKSVRLLDDIESIIGEYFDESIDTGDWRKTIQSITGIEDTEVFDSLWEDDYVYDLNHDDYEKVYDLLTDLKSNEDEIALRVKEMEEAILNK